MPRPPTVICYICQREFGTASIGIHEKTCLKRWREENAQLPASQRRPEPVKPAGFGGSPGGSNGGGPAEKVIKTSGKDPNIDQYNAASAKASQGNLAECPICHRKFNPDRLAVHKPNCHPAKPKKQVYEARKPDFDEKILRTPLKGVSISKSAGPGSSGGGSGGRGGAPSPSPSRSDNFPRCRVCNRTFAPDRIERHEMNCHAPPLKARDKSSPVPPVKGATSLIQKCTSCGAALTPNSKFCMSCGTPVKPKCRTCGGIVPPEAKFCAKCGQPVQGNRNNDDVMCLRLCSIDSYNNFDQITPKVLPQSLRFNITCYICGEDFGAKSISIHEKYCLKQWSIKNSRLPRSRQTSLPRKPQFNLDKTSYSRAARSLSKKYRFGLETRPESSDSVPLPVYVKSGLEKL